MHDTPANMVMYGIRQNLDTGKWQAVFWASGMEDQAAGAVEFFAGSEFEDREDAEVNMREACAALLERDGINLLPYLSPTA